MELREYMRVVRHSWLLIMACILTCLAGGVLITYSATPQYSSTTRTVVSVTAAGAAQAEQGGLFLTQRVDSYAELATGRELAERVISEVDVDLTPDELMEEVAVSVEPGTLVVEISVQASAPSRARQLAQAYAEQLTDLVRVLESPEGGDAAVKATVVDDAGLPDTPVFPNPVRALMLATLLGIVLGISAAVLRQRLDTTVKTSSDIERVTTAPLLGTLVQGSDVAEQPLVTSLPSSSPLAEAFRDLGSSLRFLDTDLTSKVFVVSSPLPEQGGTITALNLALTLAQSEERTVLVEGDLRRPRASTALGVDRSVGLSTVLLGDVALDEALHVHEPSGLHVLASGAVQPNPTAWLQSGATRTLVDDLRTRYDFVIIDAPPLAPVTDAALLAAWADGAVLVVRYGKTSREELGRAVQRLREAEARVAGVVLTMVPRRAARHNRTYDPDPHEAIGQAAASGRSQEQPRSRSGRRDHQRAVAPLGTGDGRRTG